MAAPVPPRGEQKQHTERPLKVYAEQYLGGGALPVGVVIDPVPAPGFPPIFSDGQPRVLLPGEWVIVHPSEWVISNRYTGAAMEVISDEEMSERFGSQGGPNVEG